jgi:hypothetical protein
MVLLGVVRVPNRGGGGIGGRSGIARGVVVGLDSGRGVTVGWDRDSLWTVGVEASMVGVRIGHWEVCRDRPTSLLLLAAALLGRGGVVHVREDRIFERTPTRGGGWWGLLLAS